MLQISNPIADNVVYSQPVAYAWNLFLTRSWLVPSQVHAGLEPALLESTVLQLADWETHPI